MTSPKPPSTKTYVLPNLVMLDNQDVEGLKAVTNTMHEHLQKVRFQVFLGEVHRNWPTSGVDSLRFSCIHSDSHERTRVYAHCEGGDRDACNQFVGFIEDTALEDESFLRQFIPLFDEGRTVTKEGMESLWRSFVGAEVLAQHLEMNMGETKGQGSPKPRM